MPLEQAQALHADRLAALRTRLAALLPSPRPVTLEIGSGHGHFLTGYAQAHPKRLCIGIDLISDRLARSQRKSDRAALPHVVWLQAEARLFLDALPAGAVLDEIFLLFSDPWPKRRHWKNRVLQPEFLSALAARAGEGARFCFRTDHADYFEQALGFTAAHPDWALAPGEPWPFELETVFQQRAEAGYQSFIARRRPISAAAAARDSSNESPHL